MFKACGFGQKCAVGYFGDGLTLGGSGYVLPHYAHPARHTLSHRFCVLQHLTLNVSFRLFQVSRQLSLVSTRTRSDFHAKMMILIW